MKSSNQFGNWISRFAIVGIVLLGLAGLYSPILAAPSTTGATIASDLADYAAGATVTLTGAGWAAGESVHIFVNDDAGQTWSLNSSPDPVADANGAFTYQFQLPNWFVANYSATATGATSGTATTTFTDSPKVGSVTVGAQTGILTYGTAGSATYAVTVVRGLGGGSSGSFNALLSITTALPAGVTASFSAGSLATCGQKTCFDSATNTIRFDSADNSLTAALTINTSSGTPAGGPTSFTVKAETSATDFATGNGTLTVGKATPTITWSNPTDIVYGTALGGTQLNATASVPGTFVYTPAAGSVLGAGSGQTLHVAFTPTDSANYNSASKDVTINVTKRAVTVSADAKSKTYGGADPALTYQITSGSLATGDSFGGSLARAAGENVGTYAITQGSLALSSNYTLTYVGANLTINPRPVTVTADAKSKTYGDGDPSLTYQITSGSLAFSDAFSGSLTRAAGETVGTYAITQGSLALSSNYTLTYVGANLTINKRAVTVTADAKSKIYGGADPALTYQITSGSLAFSDAFAGALTRAAGESVGTYAIGQGTVALSSNYTLTYVRANLTITPKAASVTPAAASKIYGSLDPTFTGTLSGFLAADGVTATYSRAAGETVLGGPYTLSAALSPAGVLSNYTITYNTASFTITPKALTVSASGVNKVYDGTTAATVTLSDDRVSGDVFTDSYTSASFADKNVGTGKTVSVSGISISGTDAGNYTFNTTASTTASITARALTVSTTGVNKVYDGTTAATVMLSDNRVSGDVFTDSYTSATFSNKNVGTAKSVSVSGIAISGTDAGNYTFNTTASTAADITARTLTVSATGVNKIYDGSTTATVTLSDDRVSGDVFTDSYTSASFADKNVGTAKAVSVSGISISGTDAGNYTVNTTASATANITLRPITVTADSQSKVYGTADPALTYQVTSGTLAFSDVFSGTLTRAAGEDVGTYAISQGTLTAGSNYDLTFVGANLTITARPVTVTADAKSKVYGDTDPALTYQITSGTLGFSDGFTGGLTRAAGEDVGTYAVTQGTLALSSNYNLTFVGADLTVTLRPITVTADAKSKVYGDTDPALTYQITSGSLAFSDVFSGTLTRAAGENVGTYAISQGSLALSSNYSLTYVGADLTIGVRSITVTADAKSKTYGDADPALTYQITTGSLAFSDAFSGSLTRAAGEDVGTYAVTQGTLALSSNYNLTFVGADLTVTLRPITVTADAKSKVYGDTDPALTYQITSGSLAFSDVFSGTLTRAAGEDVGTYAITQGSLALSSNYSLTFVGANLTITPRPITVTADPQTKVYGDADPALTYQITSGSLAFSDVFSGTLTRVSGEYAGPFPILQGTLTAGSNYDLTFVGAIFSITQRSVTVKADAKSKVYGDTDPALTYQITSGTLAFSDGFTGGLTRAAGEDVGTYAITQGSLALSSNYSLTFVGADLTITLRPITVTADPQTRVYGDADPALTYQITSGSLAFSDVFSGTLTRAAGEDVGTYAIQQGSLALSSNYSLTFVGANLTITPRPITVTADGKTKTYGDSDPALTYQITSGSLVTGDSFSGSLTRAAGEDVGTYAITQGTLALSSNYDLTFVAANVTITARPVTVTADAKSKVYGNADPALTYQITSGSLAFSDAFSGTLTRAAGEDVGTYAITLGSLALSSNYSLTFVGANLTIALRPITVTADPQTKVYGDADPALTYQITSGTLAFSDVFSGSLTRAAGEDVGTYAITQGTLALSSNYDLTFVGANLTITARPVTVTADAKSKVYGNADPALTYQITSGSLAFSDAFAGALTRVAGEYAGPYPISQGTLALSSNYNLTYVGAIFSITQRSVTVTADAQSKTYGDADPALTYTFTPALVSGDSFSGALTRVAGESVGAYAIQQGTLTAGSNYNLTYVGANLTINKRPVTVTADAKSKTYGNADPALTYQITTGSLAFSDAFSGALTRDTGESVGAYAITQGSLALGSNYDLTFVGANLTVGVRLITVTADAKSKTYGDADPALTYQITSGSLAFSDAFAGALTRVAGENVGAYAITQGSLALSSNYDLTFAGANLTINKRPVTVTADAKSKTYGHADPALTYQITSGSLAFADTFSGGLTRDAGESVGAYAITQGSLALSSNYDLSFVGANLTIGNRPVTVTADAKSKTYGDADPALTYQITSGSLAFSDAFSGALTRAAGENVGAYAIQQGTLALNSNYDLTFVGANLTIGKRPVTVTADPQTKVYGDADPALTYQTTSGSLAFADAFAGALTRVAGENVGTYAINQGALTLGSNYNLTFVGASLTITPRAVTVTADAKSKTYGNADPALTYTFTPDLVSGDNFSGGLARAAGENVGAFAIQQGTLALSSNYALHYAGANLTIGARSITVTADAKSKVYGAADPALTYQITSGSLAFADAFSGALTRVAGANVGTFAITQGTLALGTNYNLTYVGANLSITARPITVTADAKSKVYGAADPALTYQITTGSLVVGDSFSGGLTRAVGENVDTYAISQGTLALNSNYTITYNTASFTINKKPASVTPNNASKVLGATDPTFTGTLAGFVAADGVSASYSRVAGETVLGGPYTITAVLSPAGVLSNYTITYNTASFTIVYAVGGASCFGGPSGVILQPINAIGDSVFKQGSTVPAKFRDCDALGNSIGTPGVVSSFSLYKVVSGVVTDIDEQIYSTTPDTAFRWSSTDQLWIFNINTKNSNAGKTYMYDIKLNDGTHIYFQFGLK